jgi:MFS superfamily sulfate permease-like transporter
MTLMQGVICESWFRWLVAAFVALPIGHIAASQMRNWLRRKIPKKEGEAEPTHYLPASVIGYLERTFFGLVIAFEVSGAAVAMMAWIAAKLAANWNRWDEKEESARRKAIAYSISALLSGMVSMIFALVAGLIASKKIWIQICQ